MERRSFLKGLVALVGGIALEQAIPLGRVWSFPSKIVIPRYWPQIFIVSSVGEQLGIIPALPGRVLSVDASVPKLIYGASQPFRIGDMITISGINARHPITNRPIQKLH
jgi:hypothetical protein